MVVWSVGCLIALAVPIGYFSRLKCLATEFLLGKFAVIFFFLHKTAISVLRQGSYLHSKQASQLRLDTATLSRDKGSRHQLMRLIPR